MRAPRALAAVGAALFTRAYATPGAFDVDFDANPAPVAEHALRNKAYLPAQICGIIGAYIFCVLVVGTALLTYGRKMRRAVIDQRVDVVKANGTNGFEMTPVSPSSRWRSPLSPSKLKHAFKKSQTSIAERQQQSVPTSPISPSCQSMSSFDTNFLKSQQEERQKEMERLYAAVMEHDEERQHKRVASASTEEIQEYFEPEEGRHLPVQQKGRPPRLDTAASLRVPSGQHPASPISPASPRSPVRAIYPPESPMAAARRPNYTGQPPATLPSSPRGFLGKKDRTGSIGSAGSKSRRSIRNLRISGPIAKYPGNRDDEEASTPLSPRFYNPGPPPSPPSATTAPTPTTPGTADSLGPFRYEDLGRPYPLPRPHPQRNEGGRTSDARSYHSTHPSNGSNTIDIAMRIGDAPSGPPPAIRTHDLPPPPRGSHFHQASARSATSSTAELPLRSMGGPAESHLPSTKTTVVEARNRGRDLLSPRTGGLRTPATGVPMTPYSPYMPYTPITPVTPHLVTRKERKQRARDERKMGLRSPLQEGDEVGDVDWGDAY